MSLATDLGDAVLDYRRIFPRPTALAPNLALAARLATLVRELTDPEPCRFDHNGGCQEHGYLSLRPGETCPQADAQAVVATLAALDGAS